MKRSVKRAGGHARKTWIVRGKREKKKEWNLTLLLLVAGHHVIFGCPNYVCGVKRRKSKEKKKEEEEPFEIKKNQGRCVRTSRDIFRNGVSQKEKKEELKFFFHHSPM